VVTGSEPGPDGDRVTIGITVTNQDGLRVGRGTAVVAQGRV
jgi:hypothetical protein